MPVGWGLTQRPLLTELCWNECLPTCLAETVKLHVCAQTCVETMTPTSPSNKRMPSQAVCRHPLFLSWWRCDKWSISKRTFLPSVYNLFAVAAQLLTPSNTGIRSNHDQNSSSEDYLRLAVVYWLLYLGLIFYHIFLKLIPARFQLATLHSSLLFYFLKHCRKGGTFLLQNIYGI